jgi:hypothetical protein
MCALPVASVDAGDPLAAIDYAFEHGWTDGLPVVPPTPELVERFVAVSGRDPGEVVARMAARNVSCTVAKAAVNAVMAGCLPEYFPVVLAALEACDAEPYNFYGSTASTGGSAQFIVVNGPIRQQIGLNHGGNVFGPGNRANATIGRALRLIVLNVFGQRPGVTDRSTQGHPGKYSFCIAEDEETSPWEPLHVERGFAARESAVTVFAAEGTHNIQNHLSNTPEGVLTTLADEMAALGAFSEGCSAVVLAPEHAAIFRRAGWTKQQAKSYLYEHARRTLADLKRGGKVEGAVEPGDESRFRHRGRGPEDILVVVAGGEAGGHSSFIPSWSRARASEFSSARIRPAAVS